MAAEVPAVIQALECCLCFELFEEPKLLSCTHSFCEKCLEQLHHSQGNTDELPCPLCRQTTRLRNRDVSSLKTNIPMKSMVGDVKTERNICTVCDPEDKSPASYYCQHCGDYLCQACLDAHGKFKKTANHPVVGVNDIKSGKVKVKQICRKHPGEERLWVCTSCKVSICFRCRMLDHNGSDHVVQEVDDFKKNMKSEIESLQKRGLDEIERIKSFTGLVRQENTKVEAIIAEREADINKAFDETLLQLNAKKFALLSQCKEQKMKLKSELCKHGENGDELITSLNSACDLVGNGVGALLEGGALVVHTNLCIELRDMLDRDFPDERNLKPVTNSAEFVKFVRCRLKDEQVLGMLSISHWELRRVASFPASGLAPRSMAATNFGKMVAQYGHSGVKLFTVNGPQKTILKDKKVRRVSVLSDGRIVVRNWDEKLALYSSNGNKLPTKEFKMKSSYDFGGMDVDSNNNIYTVNHYAQTIRMFTPKGGAPIREIPCNGYSPVEICIMNHSNGLVVSDGCTVRVIDQQGTVKNDVTKRGFSARPAVLHDDSILIGWGKDGHVNIDLYTDQLRDTRTVILGLRCKSGHFALREFSSGEIAFCADSKFSVFRKIAI